MLFTDLKETLAIGDNLVEKNLKVFIPYFYLDGHRSSNAGKNDLEKYFGGYMFFLRIRRIILFFYLLSHLG